MIQSIDHAILLPAYLAAGTAVLVFVADLVVPRRAVSLGLGVLGSLAVLVSAVRAPQGRRTFCLPEGCSYVYDKRAMVVAVAFAALTAAVLLLSATTKAEPGEYAFLLACSMTGGVVLGAAGDLITLIVGLETLTLPLYALVALRRGLKSAEGALSLFVVSVISTAVALFGAALVYATFGAVHLGKLATVVPTKQLTPVATLGAVLLVAGLSFKVAAVPLHGWAPATYDGAPLPVTAYLSTASKLGGVFALLLVSGALLEVRPTTRAALAVLAIATMTVGNLGALRQTRMVRLLAWSSIAQAGYVLAALVVSGPAAVAYTLFFVIMEMVAFGVVIAARPDGDGGSVDDYRGLARRSPWLAGALVVALAGLAGLPPGFAGLFAKVTVVKALVDGHWTWLAVIVVLNAVLALAYYVRVGAALFADGERRAPRTSWPVAVGLAAAAAVALVVGFLPQWVLSAVGY
ncbi:NADH-quinone oxidoreductase subunit N [Longispora sp. K20-0274]|uniref:NADH-quinone oxidoreductase subunit N n=1 Tax=Longispora sp. K20-0274 TaxID=3088255 RepID=UPI00399B75DB